MFLIHCFQIFITFISINHFTICTRVWNNPLKTYNTIVFLCNIPGRNIIKQIWFLITQKFLISFIIYFHPLTHNILCLLLLRTQYIVPIFTIKYRFYYITNNLAAHTHKHNLQSAAKFHLLKSH